MTDQTLWKLESHTLGKHKVLRKYLEAWLPIMSSSNQRILFIDGFAGPGQYINNEEGSPIIAIRALSEHKAKGAISKEIGFIFIEKDEKRAQHLEGLIAPLRNDIPEGCWIRVIHGLFDKHLSEVLDDLDKNELRLAPALLMVDPFGVSETPMNVIQRVLEHPKSEVYISFMYEAINRFKVTPEFEKHLDTLFGTQEWRKGVDIQDPEARKNFFYDLYEEQLRIAGAKHVLHFELYEGDRLVYAIFFATKHDLGCDRMKQAIWNVVPWGDFIFKPVKGPQLSLGIESPDFRVLQDQIIDFMKTKGWISIDDLKAFIQSDKTSFHSSHLKSQALVPLEKTGRIEVKEGTRKKRGTFPDGTVIRVIR